MCPSGNIPEAADLDAALGKLSLFSPLVTALDAVQRALSLFDVRNCAGSLLFS